MEKELLDVTKKSGIVLFGGVFANLFSLAFNLLAIRLIGAKGYGEYVYVFTFVSFLPILGSMSFANGLIFSIPKFTGSKKAEERNALIGFCLLCGLCMSMIVLTFVFWQNTWITERILNKPELSWLLRMLAPLSVFLTIISILYGVFIGTGLIRIYVQIQNFIAPIIKMGLLLLLSLIGYKLLGLVMTIYVTTISVTLLLLRSVWKQGFLGGISRQYNNEYKSLFLFVIPLFLASILLNLNSRINMLMIGYYLSVKQVAVFNIAMKVGLSSVFVYNVLNTMFAPMISKLYHQGEMKKLEDLYKTTTKWMVAGNLIIFFLVLLFSRDIMHIFGIEFISGSVALIIITLGQIINAGTGSAAAINTMTGHSSYEFYCNLFILVVYLVFNANLIPLYGINGAALTSFFAVCISNLIRLFFVYRDHRIHPYSWEYIKVIGASVLSFGLVWGLKCALHMNWLLEMTVLSFVYIGTFVILNIRFGLSKDDQLVLDKILGKIYRRGKDKPEITVE